MEAPAPYQIGHCKKFDAFERDLTGGHHIGHLPVYVDELEGWSFRRAGVALAWRSRPAAPSGGCESPKLPSSSTASRPCCGRSIPIAGRIRGLGQ
jgi:hypothetical protein